MRRNFIPFQNLIGNALKYRRPEVAPVVNYSATAGWLLVVLRCG
jgi:hypothetical protein